MPAPLNEFSLMEYLDRNLSRWRLFIKLYQSVGPRDGGPLLTDFAVATFPGYVEREFFASNNGEVVPGVSARLASQMVLFDFEGSAGPAQTVQGYFVVARSEDGREALVNWQPFENAVTFSPTSDPLGMVCYLMCRMLPIQ